MKTLLGFILIVIWLVSCFSIVKTAAEADQSKGTTTMLYVAFIMLALFGGTGIYHMFG